MQKRMREYRLVRCSVDNKKRNRKIGVRCALAAVLSFVLVITAVPDLCFDGQSMVTEAREESVSDVSFGDVSMGDMHHESPNSESISENGQALGTPKNLFETEFGREDVLIALDAGHGGEDEGSSRAGVLEKNVNMEIVKAVESKLTAMGYQVLMVREDDETLSLEERTRIANNAGAWIYVSIHQNSCEEIASNVSGVEVWYNEEKSSDGSKRLANLIHNDLMLYTQAKDRGVVADESLYVTRETDMPACLVETGFLSNTKERELLITEEYQQRIAEGIVSGIDLYFFPKTMYLTFDDGPSAENTVVILDILKEQNVKATFFVIGENVEKHPEVAKRIVEDGHTIGIHCYSHEYAEIYKDADSYMEDFLKAKEVVYEITGVETKLFRFPGGSINAYNKAVYQEIIDKMTGQGYIYFDWNASLEDAARNNEPNMLLQNAKESTLGRRKVIMLAHDVVYNTTLCLEKLIEQFPEYRMLPLTEDVEPVHF